MLGGTYGRRVVVVAGKGNNGADGRDAAAPAAPAGRRRARASTPPTSTAASGCRRATSSIDAAYGTGFRGEYEAPDPGGARRCWPPTSRRASTA